MELLAGLGVVRAGAVGGKEENLVRFFRNGSTGSIMRSSIGKHPGI
jgi:hypothetical protein